MSLFPRIIPSLLLNENQLIKTRQFNDYKYIGDPLNAVKIFNEKKVDELIIIDKNATLKQKGPNYDLLKKLSSENFVPLCYGGGIRTIDDAYRVFSTGVEKISIQKIVFENFKNLEKLAIDFGSSSIVFSLDIIFSNGIYYIYDSFSNKKNDLSIKDCINKSVDHGVGEIILNIVNLDGTLMGPDKKIFKILPEVNIPLIYQGGISSIDDIISILSLGFQSVAVGAYFVLYGNYNSVLISYLNDDERKLINKTFNINV